MPPAPPLAAPAIPHSFSRCRIVGADNTLDYVCIPVGCKMIAALPALGWIDASSVRPGHRAAPILNCAFGACAAATADWDTPPMQALLQLPELRVAPSLAYLGQCADALDSLGAYDKIYVKTDAFLEAVEQAVARAPNPSPFEMGAGCLEATTSFLNGGSPAVPGVPGRPFVAAVPAVAAVPGRRAAGGLPAVPAVRAVRARPAVPAPARERAGTPPKQGAADDNAASVGAPRSAAAPAACGRLLTTTRRADGH